MLIHGRQEILPISLEFPSLELAHNLELAGDDVMVFEREFLDTF